MNFLLSSVFPFNLIHPIIHTSLSHSFIYRLLRWWTIHSSKIHSCHSSSYSQLSLKWGEFERRKVETFSRVKTLPVNFGYILVLLLFFTVIQFYSFSHLHLNEFELGRKWRTIYIRRDFFPEQQSIPYFFLVSGKGGKSFKNAFITYFFCEYSSFWSPKNRMEKWFKRQESRRNFRIEVTFDSSVFIRMVLNVCSHHGRSSCRHSFLIE